MSVETKFLIAIEDLEDDLQVERFVVSQLEKENAELKERIKLLEADNELLRLQVGE